MFKLGNKVSIITGASKGIGKAIALKLLKEGHSLSLGVRKKEKLNKLQIYCIKSLLSVDLLNYHTVSLA